MRETVCYAYFVSFRTPQGYGNGEVFRLRPIRSSRDVREIEKHLTGQVGARVSVVSYNYLGKQRATVDD